MAFRPQQDRGALARNRARIRPSSRNRWTIKKVINRKLLPFFLSPRWRDQAKEQWRIRISIAAAFLWTSWTSSWLALSWGWELDRTNPVPMWVAQFISTPALAFPIYLLLGGQRIARKALLVYVAYGLLFSLMFLGTAPGCLTEDSFYTFHMVSNGRWGGWYSPIHPALMTAMIQVIPWGFNAPGLFLILLWAGVYSAAHWLLAKLRAPALTHLIPPILSLLPAQLAATTLIVRDSFFSALLIPFLGGVFHFITLGKKSARNELAAISMLGSFLMFYRTDALPAALVGILSVLLIAARREGKSWRDPLVLRPTLAPLLACLLFSSLIHVALGHNNVRGNLWENRAEREYKLTLIENPLGYIAGQPTAAVSAQERQAIEQVYKFSDLKEHHCAGNLCVFYGGHWNRESSDDERSQAFKAALSVFANNPGLFMKSRMETLATVGDSNTQTACSRQEMNKRGFPAPQTASLKLDYGDRLFEFLRGTETGHGFLGGRKVWWNVPAVSLLLVLMILSFAQTPATALVAGILLLRTLAVFLAAPAGFSVYYLSLFIGGPMLAALWFAEFRMRKASGRV